MTVYTIVLYSTQNVPPSRLLAAVGTRVAPHARGLEAMTALVLAALAWVLCGKLGAVEGQLTLTRYGNTAFAGLGTASESVVEAVPSCAGDCSAPNSLRLTGQFKPSRPGQYGFNVSFDPPLPYPSEEAYCRLWVH
eukprot:COSAG02_NODE_505_length_20935_cov_38.509119_1_plen_135_part_10